MSRQFPNYLRANRKRLALSQQEVAFLLGAGNGAKVCRYERFLREPNLRGALACEAVFDRPMRELFAGVYKDIEKQVAIRARLLLRKAEISKPNRRVMRKRQILGEIVARSAK